MQMQVKLILPFLVLFLGIVACEKEEVSTDDNTISEIILSTDLQEVETSALPHTSQKYIDDNYFDTYVDEVRMAPRRGFMVTLGIGEVLYFNLGGEVLDFDGEFVRNGPLGPIHPHGPCFRLRRWLRGHGGNHDCDGDGVPDGPFAYDPDELPETITGYVAENYPDTEIRRAAYRDDRYLLLITGGIVLAFDGDGNFLREINILEHCQRVCNGLTEDELSDAVATYIAENFPDAVFRRACSRAERTLVLLSDGDQRVVLGFDAEGNLIFQRP